MSRTGIYLVRRDTWYAERAVWLAFGLWVLLATALAWWVHPSMILLATVSGVFSVLVGATGVCAVGTLMLALGFTSRLGDREQMPRVGPLTVYRMRTDSWFLERRIYPIVGVNMILGSLAAYAWSPWWLLFTLFVGAASIVFAWSGFCIIANGMWRLGAEPRLGCRGGSCDRHATLEA